MSSWLFFKSDYNVADVASNETESDSDSGRTTPVRHEGVGNGSGPCLDGIMSPTADFESDYPLEVSIDDAIERLGYGRFQIEILFAAGLCFAADAMEVLLLSFLAVVLRAEWLLTPKQESSIVSTVFAGAMIGTLILSPLGDAIGRRPIFTVTAAIIAIFGVVTSFCLNYTQLLIVRFLVGFGVGGLTVPFDTLSEVIPSSHRGQNLLWIEFFWTGGSLLVPLVAWWSLEGVGSWRLFVILCSVPCIVSALLGIFLVPESPRWLLTRGRHDRALHILRRAAAKNGRDPYKIFPSGTILISEEEDIHNEHSDDSDVARPMHSFFGGIFSMRWRGLMIVLGIVWAGLAFLYYGTIIAVSLVFSSEEDGQTGTIDKEGTYDFDYSAIFITSSAEIFGLVLVLGTVDRWGRIVTQKWTYVLGGVSCFLLGLVDFYAPQSRTFLVAFAYLARLFMMGASCVTWVSTSEILPTEIRTTGHGFANAMGRIGGFVSPFIISPENSLRFIGVVLVSAGIVTGWMTSRLPETKGKALGGFDKVEFQSPQTENPPDVGNDSLALTEFDIDQFDDNYEDTLL